MKLSYGLILIFLASLVAGCEQLGINTPATEAAREEAEGRAIGSACRQSARVLEECYQLNRRASKAAIFGGWRDMDAYMRENKIEEIKPEPEQKAPEEKSVAPATVVPAAEQPKPAQKSEAASAKPSAGQTGQGTETQSARKPRPALAR